ncbi:hypothetical protein CXB51_006568 [Gossypium anomalum]|uniref:EGF-like domain-containing protein n=1 Tax=Gossypium anomalum TaxID=47600 RepID=A0A8J5Z2V6_9ROSI|nr:hypothetical protein CXB51_006568 [Gossypium anomalum]
MSSLKTLAFLSIFLLLHLKIAKTDFLSPLLSPLFGLFLSHSIFFLNISFLDEKLMSLRSLGFSLTWDDVCKEVECGRGKCKPSINGTLPFYVCECDPGWKQTFSDKDDHAHLKFLPCIVPNCSMNNVCSAAPSPAQEEASDSDQSAFDICRWTNCGGGSCNRTSPFTYDCRCSEGYFNLLNVSAFPCYKECAIGLDCANLGISLTNKSTSVTPTPTPSTSQNDVNQACLKLLGTWHWVIVLVLLLAMFA